MQQAEEEVMHRLSLPRIEEKISVSRNQRLPEEDTTTQRQPQPQQQNKMQPTTRHTCIRNHQHHQMRNKMVPILLLVIILQHIASQSTAQVFGGSKSTSSNQLLLGSPTSQPSTAILMDTTVESSLGWTKYPDGGPQTRTPGWVEESFTNFERGINWRSFVVCDVAFDSVNNWLWTPWIERGEANRLTIEIKFTMRDCNLFPQVVRSCKETFALLYKEMDQPLNSQQQHLSAANASFALADNYTLVDAIAADGGRFTSDTDVIINTEIRSIPVSKRGVYFAFRDQGACLSLISIKVYYVNCPEMVTNFARFNATPTGRDASSLVAVDGQCVPNSVLVEQPRMFCSANGQWNSITSGQCKCLPGFEPQANQTRCQACPPGKFKPTAGDATCQPCPEHSAAPAAGSSECRCLEGFYRSPRDSRSAGCSQPPGAAQNLSATYVDSTSVVLQWQAPKFTGHRDDLAYKLTCDQCASDQTTLVSSPPQFFYANFSETKCVLSGLQPATTYRFVLYTMNGVTSQSMAPLQHSEILVQTQRQSAQSPANTLSSSSSPSQLMPIYNFRALPGARGSDMVLAWDAQSFQQLQLASGSGTADSVQDSFFGSLSSSSSATDSLPALYELKFQPRFGGSSQESSRRSPYPLIYGGDSYSAQNNGPQSVTTTNRAIVITTLQPRTDYSFQIRAKWSNSAQWTDFSEPIYMSTTNQLPSPVPLPDFASGYNGFPFDPPPQSFGSLPPLHTNSQQQQRDQLQSQSPGSWLATFALVLFCALISLAVISVTLIYYRKSLFIQSLGAGFGHLNAHNGGGSGPGSTYGGAIYGNGGLIGGGFGAGNTLGAFGVHPTSHHLSQHHATMSSSSAGGLITGSNGTSRSSSGGGGGGAGNVVQNFIAATLNQISGTHSHSHTNNHSNKPANHHQLIAAAGHTLGGLADGKQLFAVNTGDHHQQQQPRNHYHQTLTSPTAGHTLLPASGGFPLQPQQQHLAPQRNTGDDLFKYRTMNQQQAGAQQQFAVHQHQQQRPDPQLHIYDDLDNACATIQRQNQKEIDPQRVTIESVIGRGEFGEVCLGKLRSPITGAESRVAVKRLKPQTSEKAKLDFLVEAYIMSQLAEHPNIIHLEGVVTKSEPFMIVTEYMENGSLDSYLRENKNRFTCLQLISMLRGIANGMQYLAKLNYVHKDLAARNILVNAQNVCKIADFGLSAHQPTATRSEQLDASSQYGIVGAATTDSGSSNSSQTSGSTPTTASTLAGSSQLTQLYGVAEQLAHQRFSQEAAATSGTPLMQQHQQHHHQSIQNPKIPVRWTALEAIAFRRFTSASDVWSFGVLCWEVMSEGERPYWSWSNQDVIKAVEQGYRLPQPDGCPEQLYKLMLDCWLKDPAARPTFVQLVRSLDRLLSPYDDPFSNLGATLHNNQQHQLVPTMQTRISSQEPAYYDTYNPISQLISTANSSSVQQGQHLNQQTVDEWLTSIKMSRYRENFQRHQINSLQYVVRLSQADLQHIGIQNNQHIKKIMNAIQSLRSTSSIGASGEGYLV